GKGRKLCNTPLRKDTISVLRTWLAERQGRPSDCLPHDIRLPLESRRPAISAQQARRRCLSPMPSLHTKHVAPHVLCHAPAPSGGAAQFASPPPPCGAHLRVGGDREQNVRAALRIQAPDRSSVAPRARDRKRER